MSTEWIFQLIRIYIYNRVIFGNKNEFSKEHVQQFFIYMWPVRFYVNLKDRMFNKIRYHTSLWCMLPETQHMGFRKNLFQLMNMSTRLMLKKILITHSQNNIDCSIYGYILTLYPDVFRSYFTYYLLGTSKLIIFKALIILKKMSISFMSRNTSIQSWGNAKTIFGNEAITFGL